MTPAVPTVETFGDLAFGDIFLHLLTGTLALLADEFAVEDFCSGLFDGFLLTAAPRYLGGRTGAGWAGGRGGLGLRHLWPLPGRRTCSVTRCGCSCTCTTAWRRPSCRPCRRRWSPPARWVPGHARAGRSPSVWGARSGRGACPPRPRAFPTERRGREGALLPARRETGAAGPAEAQPRPGCREPGPGAARASCARPGWPLTRALAPADVALGSREDGHRGLELQGLVPPGTGRC